MGTLRETTSANPGALPQQAFDHVSVHIGKTSLNAIVVEGKPFVVEA